MSKTFQQIKQNILGIKKLFSLQVISNNKIIFKRENPEVLKKLCFKVPNVINISICDKKNCVFISPC